MTLRRVYTSGKSEVIAVPSEWAGRVEKLSESQVEMREYGNLLLISPYSGVDRATQVFRIVAYDLHSLELDLASRYIIGARIVLVRTEIANIEKVKEILVRLQTRHLYGMSFRKSSETEFIVDFSPPVSKIPELIENEFDLNCEMMKIVSGLLAQESTQIPSRRTEVDDFETSVDQTSFRVKRSLLSALNEPEIMIQLELGSMVDILAYHRIEMSFERLADLQQEISVYASSLNETISRIGCKFDRSPLKNVFESGCDLVKLCHVEYGSQKAVAITRPQVKVLPPGIFDKARLESENTKVLLRKKIPQMCFDLAREKTSDEEMRLVGRIIECLWNILSRIEGMIGLASNIYEAESLLVARVVLENDKARKKQAS
ncbi:MAG: hypothetical protein ACYCPP_07905 [Nitrososphaerales archaeon]